MDRTRHVEPNGRTTRLRLFALATVVIVAIVCSTILIASGNDAAAEPVGAIGLAAIGALAGMRH